MRFTRTKSLVGIAAVAALGALPAATSIRAATPPSGTVSSTNPTVSYQSGPFFVANASGTAGAVQCGPGLPCDDYGLTVATSDTTKNLNIQIAWPNTTADFDLYVLNSSGAVVASSATSADPEQVVMPDVAGTYTVRVVPFNPLGQTFTGTASIVTKPTPPAPGTGIAPRYQNYTPPAGSSFGTDAGEPSIGANWNTGNVLFQSYLDTLKVSFNDSTSPAQATWTKSRATNALASLDPILFTDHATGRTFESQLTGQDSLSSFTDNDGATWTPSQGGGIPSGVDHQTVGGGPYAAGTLVGPLTSYKDAVYYCSQDIAASFCARSDNGGLTFGAGVPIYTMQQCGGLHGHVKVAPDGTVYVPNKSCGANQAVVVSTDNGTTWSVRPIPDSTAGQSDPSVGIGANGTIYFGYQGADGHAHVAVSKDRGLTWSHSIDVGAQFGIQNSVFPAVTAGDDNRAAFAFLGTPTGGNYQDAATFQGIWHLYIAHTFDGGTSWITSDATPNDPVQRGSICTGGTTCGQDRNLLDFMDITTDKQGRVLVGYADGCIGGCVQSGPNSFSALATIARESGGRRMFAAYDTAEPTVPRTPTVTATKTTNPASVTLSWQAPDNGGSAITKYNIYRATKSGAERLYTTTTKTTYTDTSLPKNATYYYKVAAVNSVGTGALSAEVTPTVVVQASPCTPPGLLVATDPTGDQVGAPANQDLDITAIHAGESGSNLVMTMNVANLSTMTPNREWKMIWNFTGGPRYYAGMTSNAAGQVSYDYGRVADTTNVPTSIGPAGSGSAYGKDGTITIVVPKSGVGSPAAGNSLGGLHGRTFAGQGNIAITQSASADYTAQGSYTVAGNCP